MIRWRITGLILIVFTVVMGLIMGDVTGQTGFRFEVLDVGQGDSLLVTTPEGINLLIDGGPGDNVLRSLGDTLSVFDRRIDAVLLTHPDADHIEGLIPVLRRYNVALILRTESTKTTATYQTFEQTQNKEGAMVENIYLGDKIMLGEQTSLDVLWPPAGQIDEDKVNESSIVARLSYQGYDFLLTGDIGEAAERKIIKTVKLEYLQSEILKVPHHGSKYSSSREFLGAVSPRVSAISVGTDNRYGHPTAEALARLSETNSEILRTDIDGDIIFEINRKGLVVKTDK